MQAPAQLANQPKAQIYIENLDQGISEDYLYRKFKEVGDICNLKIAKDKTTQKSKGQAYITFTNQDSAEEARKRFNNAVFIKNAIRVKPYFNYHTADKKANIFINNLPEDADPLELEQEFSRFGNVLSLDIHRDSQGRPLNYGYVQFEKKEEVEKLVEQVQKQPFIFKGKVLKLEQFKAQTERKTESSAIYLRAFARPLNKDITEKQQKAIEYAWQLIITQHLKEAGNQVLDCFVKLDSQNKQPWAMVRLGSPEEAKINLDICEATRTHPSTQSSAEKALKLIKAAGPPADSIGQKQFEIKDVEPYFQELIKDPNDPFKGESENFFYNQVYSKHLNPDDRLILIQNINEDVTKEQVHDFLSQFGKVIRLTVRTTKNPRFHVKQGYAHYQTLEDSKRARSEVYDDNNLKIVELRKQIFKEGRVMMNILLSKSVRKEYKEIKKAQQTNIYQNPQSRNLLQPQNNNLPPFPVMFNNQRPMMAPMPGQPRQPFPPNARGPMMPRPPQQQRPQAGGRPYQPYGGQQRPPFPGGFPPGQGQQFMPQPQFAPQYMGQPNFPPQFAQPQFPQQFTAQQPQQLPQQGGFKFQDYETVRKNFNDFTSLPQSEQRDTLGRILHQKVKQLLIEWQEYKGQEENYSKKVVPMLVDEQLFEISDIINFFENNAELVERVQEAIALILSQPNPQA